MKLVGRVLVWFSLVITFNLLILAKLTNGETLEVSWLFLSQVLAVLGTVLLSISFWLAGRFRFVESWFGGLDKVYRIHQLTGGAAMVMLLHHPLFLAINVLPRLDLVWGYFWFSRTISYDYGITALYLMLLLVALTLVVNLPYSVWKRTHEMMGLVLFFGALHALTIPSDISRFTPLRLWLQLWLALAGWAVVYRRFLYEYIGPKYHYLIDEISDRGEVLLVWLRPVNKKMTYRAGQFVMINFPGVVSEKHPFSVASNPHEERLGLGIKVLGDDTLRMKRIKVGDWATVWGPYGSFGEKLLTKRDLIWIAGGIGMTSFMSMLFDESIQAGAKKIDLFYCVARESEAVFDEQIKKAAAGRENINYRRYLSSERGRMTAAAVAEAVGSLANKKIMFCGPAAMTLSLIKQFKQLGVANSQLVYEDFSFK